MTINTEALEQKLEKLKKELDLMAMWAKELLETSRPELDPLKESRYICASCFLAPILKNYESN